jgi:hypothetical protein
VVQVNDLQTLKKDFKEYEQLSVYIVDAKPEQFYEERSKLVRDGKHCKFSIEFKTEITKLLKNVD